MLVLLTAARADRHIDTDIKRQIDIDRQRNIDTDRHIDIVVLRHANSEPGPAALANCACLLPVAWL